MEPITWAKNFEHNFGRKCRVLFIGNIANNGYLNARILRSFGFDANVLCVNDYFLMSSPIWEEYAISIPAENAYNPDWGAANFQNPAWFVQGATHGCLDYITARFSGNESRSIESWRRLEFARWMQSSDTQECIEWKRKCSEHGEDPFFPSFSFIKGWRHPREEITAKESRRRSGAFENFISLFTWATTKTAPISEPAEFENDYAGQMGVGIEQGRSSDWAQLYVERTHPDISIWAAKFSEMFPERDDRLELEDLTIWANYPQQWRDALQYFDFVVATATYGAIPLLTGHPHYLCYEHGTIRDIPFQKNGEGRLCALTYRSADSVFITNTDVLPQARNLGLIEEKVFNLPHAFQANRVIDWSRDAEKSLMRDSPSEQRHVYFIAPARQHWKHGFDTWLKGNDLIVHAIAKLKDMGKSFRVQMIEWGQEVDLTKELIEKLNCENFVEWLPPMSKPLLRENFVKSQAVIDQFVMPALGTTAIEGLACGRRVITRIDQSELAQFFGNVPPVLNAATSEEIADQMLSVINDPTDQSKIGIQSQKWLKKYHSS